MVHASENKNTKRRLDTPLAKTVAWSVHVYTATGLVVGLLAVRAIFAQDLALAFTLMTLAVLIDASDGALARRYHVKTVVPRIDGRKLDDIVDYLNYTFIPILLVYQQGWLPNPGWLWAAIPLIASGFAFVHTDAKEEAQGFFRGFPSYWNVVAFYVAIAVHHAGDFVVLFLLLFLSVLSVSPVRFVYPNRPPCWPVAFVGGGLLWLISIAALLWLYPRTPTWLLLVSLIYPVFYIISSIWLDWKQRRTLPSRRHADNNSRV